MKKGLFGLLFGLLLACVPSCEQSGSSSPEYNSFKAAAKEPQMSMSPVSAGDYGGTLPLVSILCPDAGEEVKAEDIREPVAALLASDAAQNTNIDGKVAKAGDTMTGSLVLQPDSGIALAVDAAVGQEAVDVLGSGATTAVVITSPGGMAMQLQGGGSVAAITATGGASGPGGRFVAGGTNYGVRGEGADGFPGGSFLGGPTGPGLVAQSGTAPLASTPTEAGRFTGFIRLNGADPDGGVDPGENNVIHPATIMKASVTIDSSYAILERYNVASVTQIMGDEYRVTFTRPMANALYGVKIFVHGAPGYSGAMNSIKTTTHFNFVLFKTTDLSLGFGTADEAYIEVTGRQ